MLQVEHLSKSFGGIQAVRDCSFDVYEGSITGLIGPNGAGKTTLFNLITGFLQPDSGRVFYRKKDITGLEPFEIFRQGIFRSFQITREYKEMTVLENLLLIPEKQIGEILWNAWLQRKAIQAQEARNIEKALEILRFLGMESKKDLPAKHLPGGEKKLLEIGRMMMVDLDLILLDEPGAGVPPGLQQKVLNYIKTLAQEHGHTLLMVEHDMDVIMNICDRIIVTCDGTFLTEGTPDEIRSNPAVIEAYLGTPYEANE
ncbi:MAG: ABC transporter ATP-binding protein [Deltaproteobacteria bacterium]|nr:ABC transporter ATP-binding protein [Deltaproteobacteria bacterium]